MYSRGFKGWLKHIDFIFLDLIALYLAFFMAYFMRNGFRNPMENYLYRDMIVVISLIDLVVISFLGSLKNVLKRGYYKEFTTTIKHSFMVVILSICYLFFTQKGDDYSRITMFFMGIYYVVISYILRILWKNIFKKQLAGSLGKSLVIISTKDSVQETIDNVVNDNYKNFHISGIVLVDVDWTGREIQDIPVVANIHNVDDFLCREWIDEVFIDLAEDEPCLQKLIEKLNEMGIVIHMKLAKVSSLVGQRQMVENYGKYTVLTSSINYATPIQALEKRIIDIMGGLVGCLITGILFVFLAPLIYKESPGPIFFTQVRVGRNGKKFKIYKFRSMYLDAEERKEELMKKRLQELKEQGIESDRSELMFKDEQDPRIIGFRILPDGKVKKGIGNFIRDYSLDEFPQFLNVLKGDMSLVGTRPPTVDEWEKYELHHRARLAIKPGITGMWQTSGRSEISDFEDVVKLDTQYISEWSAGLDIRLLFKTVKVVLTKEGSM